MDNKDFRFYLISKEISSTTIDSIINWVEESENFLGKTFDSIVIDDEETYQALEKLKQIDKSFGLSTQYALRKYYEFVNNKQFPKRKSTNKEIIAGDTNLGQSIKEEHRDGAGHNVAPVIDGFYRCCIDKCIFVIPNAFEVDKHEASVLRAYAETGENTVMLMIHVYTDEEEKAAEEWFDNGPAIRSFGEDFIKDIAQNGSASIIDENIESIGGLKGYFLRYSYNILNVSGKGQLFRFPVYRDNKWVNIGIMKSNSSIVDYDQSFKQIIESFYRPGDIGVDDTGMLGASKIYRLKRAGMNYLNDVMLINEEELSSIRNIGKKCTMDIIAVLEEYGLCLREQYQEIDSKTANVMCKVSSSVDEIDLTRNECSQLKRAGLITIRDILSLDKEPGFDDRRGLWRVMGSVLAKLKKSELPRYMYLHLEDRINIYGGVIEASDGITQKQIDEEFWEYYDADGSKCKAAIEEAAKRLAANDYNGAIESFKMAVKYGYNGDYSIIGYYLLTGDKGVAVDKKEGIKWLFQFYSHYKSGFLNLDEYGGVVNTCYNLGVCWLWAIQEGNNTGRTIDDVTDIWKEAIDIAYNNKIDSSETVMSNLYTMGCCLYTGVIHSEGHEDYFVEKDPVYARKALEKSEKMGFVNASIPLAEMFETGNGVDTNIRQAEIYYINLVLAGNEEAIDWCQRHFIDSLPWDKKEDWSDIAIYTIHGYPKCSWVFSIIGIKNVQQCREGFFNTIAGDERVIENKNLVKLGLKALREFMEKY